MVQNAAICTIPESFCVQKVTNSQPIVCRQGLINPLASPCSPPFTLPSIYFLTYLLSYFLTFSVQGH